MTTIRYGPKPKPLTKEAVTEYLAQRTERKPNGCLEWKLRCTEQGYGEGHVASRKYLAHRLAWFAATGFMPPPTIYVCHDCDNPPCCDFDHLFLGTQADNIRDAANKGRTKPTYFRGSQIGTSRFTEEDVYQMHRLKKAEGWTYQRIANHFNTNKTHVCDIIKRRAWAHITYP